MALLNLVMFIIALVQFSIPLDHVSDVLIKFLGFLFVFDVLFLIFIGLVVMAADSIVFRRFDLTRDEFIAAILPVLDWNNVTYEVFDRLVATPVEYRMDKGSVVHYSLNGGEEDMYIGTVRMRLEVALDPYEGDHVKFIDRLMREIDVTLDNL